MGLKLFVQDKVSSCYDRKSKMLKGRVQVLTPVVVTENKTSYGHHYCCSSRIWLERDHKLHHESISSGDFWRAWTNCWHGKRCLYTYCLDFLLMPISFVLLTDDFVFFRFCVWGWWDVTAARPVLTWCWLHWRKLWNNAIKAKFNMDYASVKRLCVTSILSETVW